MTLRERAAAAGIDATTIVHVLDVAPSTVGRALDGELSGRHVEVVIAAWEIMSPEQRARWLDALNVSAERPKRGRPRKDGLAAG